MNFGNNLKKLRADRNLSQEQLAEKLKISRQAISKWESGKAYPDIENLVILRNIFDVTLDELIINDNIIGCKDIKKRNRALKDIYLKPIYNKEDKLDEKDTNIQIHLMTVGSMIGMAIGFTTNNPIWAVVGPFVGIGIGHVLEVVIKKL